MNWIHKHWVEVLMVLGFGALLLVHVLWPDATITLGFHVESR